MRSTLLILFFLPFFGFGQSYFKDHFGGSIGLVANIGTHVNSIGLNVNGYHSDNFYQFNLGTTFYLHQSSYGGRKYFWENRNAAGIVLLAGKKERNIDFEFDGLNHQTQSNYGLGFNYLFYFDKKGTSQASGGFALHLKNTSIYHENDVFAGTAKDRFRTGHFRVSYLYNDFKFATGINLWTGESRGVYWQKITFDGCPAGFKILEDTPYGRTAHGNLYASVLYNLPYRQNVHLKIGIDSEHIRHIFQNRMIHDFGRFVGRSAPHYPRLDKNGCPTFEKSLVRKDKLFLQFGTNDNWSN
jgi:hypothetical protein